MNSRRASPASSRARLADRATRALSVAMPVFAYICRYSFDSSTKASRGLHRLDARRALPDGAQRVEAGPTACCVPARISSGRHAPDAACRSSAACRDGISQ